MRPQVIVNCAMSVDGKISTKERRQVRISSEEDLARVRALRLECDAILVGVGTVVADDPHLTVKGQPKERQPLRIVLDPQGRTPSTARVLNDWAETLIVTLEGTKASWHSVSSVGLGKKRIDLMALMDLLEKRGVRSILVEGGGETIFSFFQAGLVDRYTVFVGSKVLGGKTSPTPADGEGFLEKDAYSLKLVGVERMGDGVLLSYERA
ncbi:MAG: 2,5-diamino-6-ribosylamino-4(3H)-pyrimidinone 5'-phosphate reductase [Methanomassiliicoccales archaeon PtaU1.Bin124]|nr:MAG: 2,5-diamino-6-ribosylamino-4(3H)-pyrimidinone 5'-phosphate reductase [Methanomassiliicoccales archaeon PtaU1.Bin124]